MDPVESLAPVSLEQVNAEAAMLTRLDRKYVVPAADLAALVDGLPGCWALQIDGVRWSRYESTYLDTPVLAAWHAAARGHRRRWKLRTRRYVESGDCWLELKTRGPRGTTVKERIPHRADLLDEVGADAAPWVSDRLAAARVNDVEPLTLVPSLQTFYRRATLLPLGGGRATIDRDLLWSCRDRSISPAETLIIETKSAPGQAGAVDRQLWRLGHRPVRISKYGTGLQLLHPDLPHNRWHRVASTHLAPTLVVPQGVLA